MTHQKYYKERLKVIRDPDREKIQGTKTTKVNGVCDTNKETICVRTNDGSQNDRILDFGFCRLVSHA